MPRAAGRNTAAGVRDSEKTWHVAVDERDPDTGVDGEPAVLPGEHVGGGRSLEEASALEPADHAAPHPLRERGQIGQGDWPGRQERRRGVTACLVSSRHAKTVGHARAQVHVLVERRAEAVEEGDAAEPLAGGSPYVGIRGAICPCERGPLVTAEEFKEWFAKTPASFRCHTQLVDKDGEEVAGDVVEIGKFGAARLYHNLLWCVPLYVNLHNACWYTPELRLVRSIEIDEDDAANISSLNISLERGSPLSR